MKKQYLTILLTFVGFVGLSGVVQAAARDEIVVTLPFEFVANGKTFPAGTYTVSRFSDDKLGGLILSSHENRVHVIVFPITVESAGADKPSVSFERVGESRLLAKIETAHDVYTIPPSRVEHGTLAELR